MANYNDNTVSVINTATSAVTATVDVGTGPAGVAVNPAGTYVYVANSSGVSVISTATNTVTATVNVPSNDWRQLFLRIDDNYFSRSTTITI